MRTNSLLCAIGLSCAAVAAAQAQGTPATSPMSNAAITVRGCLERGTQSATPGATGTSGSAANGFVLSDVKPAAGSAPGAARAPIAGTSFRLDGTDATLSPHVGHKVEIKGTVESSSASAVGSASSTASNAPRLKVDTIKMIASNCAQ